MPGPYWFVTTDRLGETAALVNPEQLLAEVKTLAIEMPSLGWRDIVLRPSTTDDGMDCYIDMGHDDEMFMKEATSEDLKRMATERIMNDQWLDVYGELLLAEQPEGDDHYAWVITASDDEIFAWVKAREGETCTMIGK